jgi:hypothetical protein
VFKGLVLDLTLIPTTGKCIFSRSVNSHDTPTTLLEDRASDGKSKESGLYFVRGSTGHAEQQRFKFAVCGCELSPWALTKLAGKQDDGRRRGYVSVYTAAGWRLFLSFGRNPLGGARQIRVSVVPSFQAPHHIYPQKSTTHPFSRCS